MKNQLFSLVICTTLAQVAYAQDFPQRVRDAYAQTDKAFDLDCSYSRNQSFKLITPVSQTVRSRNQLSREFILEGQTKKVPMTFHLNRVGRSFEYKIVIDRVHESSGTLVKREFAIAPIANGSMAREFETASITCSVNLATAPAQELTDGDYHFSVHPHTIYDWQAKLKAPVESYLADPGFKSIILLETGMGRGNLVDLNRFMDGSEISLPASQLKSDLVNVPKAVPLIVSPAGNNRFKINATSELNITFSGGNHNYCIWNSTRHVLIGLMNSRSAARVNFIYDTRAIVAQQRGMEGLVLNFSKQAIAKSNLLADLLSNTGLQENYHFSYLIFFRNLFAQEYSGMYRTFKVNYEAPGYRESFTMHGDGLKDLEVNFNYL